MPDPKRRPWRPSLTTDQREELEQHERESIEKTEAMFAGHPQLEEMARVPRHFDRDGQPMSFADWVEAYEDNDYRMIGNDVVGAWEISTIWTGMDATYGILGTGPALPCESIVFHLVGDERVVWTEPIKYPSAAVAKVAHANLVDKAKRDKIKVSGEGVELDDDGP